MAVHTLYNRADFYTHSTLQIRFLYTLYTERISIHIISPDLYTHSILQSRFLNTLDTTEQISIQILSPDFYTHSLSGFLYTLHHRSDFYTRSMQQIRFLYTLFTTEQISIHILSPDFYTLSPPSALLFLGYGYSKVLLLFICHSFLLSCKAIH